MDLNSIIRVISGIKNENELAEFIAKQNSIEMPLNGFQWRCFIVQDYSETESIFILKVHHTTADGMSLMCLMNDITDDPKVEGYPNMRPLTSA